MDRDAAIKATKNGAIAACITAMVTVAAMVFAIASDTEGALAIWNNPLNVIDVILIFACAFGIYKKSRVAALLLFIYFIGAKIVITIETQNYSGLGVALVFLYFYGKAVQGAFVYHRIEKLENPNYKATSKWWYFLGIPSAILILAGVMFSVMSTTGVVPSTRVLAQDEINKNDLQILQANAIISPDDNVAYFYAGGLSSMLESGNLLTQDRVILYLTDEDKKLQIYELFFNEIVDVQQEEEGSSISDSVYHVSTDSPDRWLKLFLSTEQKGNKKFVNELQKRVHASRTLQ